MNSSLEAMYRRVWAAAVEISAVEMAFFSIGGTPALPNLHALRHCRPDPADEATRAAAVVVFKELITRSIGFSDGIIEIVQSESPDGLQYCFVHFGYKEGRLAFAATFIRRCKSGEETRDVLKQVQDQRIFN